MSKALIASALSARASSRPPPFPAAPAVERSRLLADFNRKKPSDMSALHTFATAAFSHPSFCTRATPPPPSPQCPVPAAPARHGGLSWPGAQASLPQAALGRQADTCKPARAVGMPGPAPALCSETFRPQSTAHTGPRHREAPPSCASRDRCWSGTDVHGIL